jgi:hypothetical protein
MRVVPIQQFLMFSPSICIGMCHIDCGSFQCLYNGFLISNMYRNLSFLYMLLSLIVIFKGIYALIIGR